MSTESNSAIIKIHKNSGYTIMSNHHLRNLELGLKAVGLMSKILGLPDGWHYSVAGLVSICKEGETAVRAALAELAGEHYIYVEKLTPRYSKSGRFEYIYHIYEIPYEEVPEGLEHPELFIPVSKKKQPKAKLNAESQSSEKQDAENLYVEIQGVEKQGQLKTYRSNTKELNTKEIKKEKIKEKPKASKPDKQKKQYAEAVYMTETEYQILCEKHSKEFADRCIEVLNNYKLSKGKFYRSDYHAILAWVEKKVLEDIAKSNGNNNQPLSVSMPVKTDPNENPFTKFLNESGGA